MISALKALFEVPARETTEQRERRLHLVAAALLVETARADFTQGSEEQVTMERLLSESLDLELTEVRQLIDNASAKVDESTSLYEFTREINDNFTPEQKLQLVADMWAVAYADGNLDRYEEHLIRRVAELTYVSHVDYIRLKLAARDTAKG